MKSSVKSSIVSGISIVLTCAGALLSYAQAPSGTATLQVNDPANALWDVSRVEELQVPDYWFEDAEVHIQYQAPFEQDGAGKFVGSGSADVLVENPFPQIEMQSATYKVTGSVTSKGGIVRVTHTALAVGTGVAEGIQTKVNTSRSVLVTINLLTHELTGTYKISASASGVGSTRESGVLEGTWDDLAAQLGSGTWVLELTDLVTDPKNKVTGTGTVTLQGGKEYQFAVKGAYNAKTGLSKLTLAPLEGAKGSTLKVVLMGNQVVSAMGKISGQAINVQ